MHIVQLSRYGPGAILAIAAMVTLGTRGTSHAVDSCTHPATVEEVGRSLYTIFLEGARTEHPIPAPALLPLLAAADRVFCDADGTRRRGRMRYAATKLAAARTILKRKSAPPPMIQRFNNALARLQFPSVLLDTLESSPATTLADLEDAAGDLIDATSSSSRPTILAFRRFCCPCIDSCDVGSADSIATIEFEIHVQRTPQELAHVIDPRSWKTLLGMYFTASDEVKVSPPCQNEQPVCFHPDGPCRPGNEPAPATTTNVQQPGTPWCGLLFEAFKAQWSSTSATATFDNVIGIRTRHEPPGAAADKATGFRMDFRLCEAIGHTSGGVAGDCGVDLDCGYAHVTEDGVGGSAVYGTKRVSFIPKLNPDANAWAPIALEVMAKETALALCGGPPSSDQPCECYRDRCVQHKDYEPQWETEFCD